MILIGTFAGLLFFPFLGRVHLFDWNEINFAESAREMIATGHTDLMIDFLVYQVRLFSTGDEGHSGTLLCHPLVLLAVLFPASLFFLGAHFRRTPDPADRELNRHYSSMRYFPMTYLAATMLIFIISMGTIFPRKVEGFSQHTLIGMCKSMKGKQVYFKPHGLHSYHHLFYSEKQQGGKDYNYIWNFLELQSNDYPIHLVTKKGEETEILQNYPGFRLVTSRNGYLLLFQDRLEPGTIYYLRADATNAAGTAYGSTMVFQTLADTFTDSRDGNLYHAIQIGDQIWMAENLKYLPYMVGTTGFNALPGGYYRAYEFNFISLGFAADYWCADENSDQTAWHRQIASNASGIHRNPINKNIGLSIRCVKDIVSIKKVN